MKILVTGGAGFIGSHVADRFVRDGHDVVVQGVEKRLEKDSMLRRHYETVRNQLLQC
jgi:nucleoside-diphosphate-sugar epimerase